MTKKFNQKIKARVFLILLLTSLFSFFTMNFSNDFTLIDNKKNDNQIQEDNELNTEVPKTNLPTSSYEWWNTTWSFRIPVQISSAGAQQNAPVELQVNFTKYLNDLSVENPWLDKRSIRVVEYYTETSYTELECEFEPLQQIYNNETNAIGDVIWILNGSTSAGTLREFFIYFNNGTNSGVPEQYTNMRIWHEGFEQGITLIRPTDGQDNYQYNAWEISNTTSARGRSSLRIWGNCWKAEETKVSFTGLPNLRVTAKMRFDDPTLAREISGLGFNYRSTAIPDPAHSYNIRGNQDWGRTDYKNQYYAANTFYWYTLTYIAHDEYIFFIADDDSYSNLNLYWDDISVWSTTGITIQTVPDKTLSIIKGGIQASSFTLKISAQDENGFSVPNAMIYLTNNSQPSINQNHVTNNDGQWIFTEIEKNGIYNITINYTQNGLDNPKTKTVYFNKNYQIQKLTNELTAMLNLTSFEFNVSYKNGDPIQNGFVSLKDGSNEEVGRGYLNSIGNTTLYWLNSTTYNYEAYFDYTTLPYRASYINPIINISNSIPASQHYININTQLCNLTCNVTEFTDGTEMKGAKLRFYNETESPTTSTTIANITVQSNGLASFISFKSDYGNWKNYTIDVYYGGKDDWQFEFDGRAPNDYHNFSLDTSKIVDVIIYVDQEDFNTTLEIIQFTENATWGEDFSFIFNFTKQNPTDTLPVKIKPDELYFQVLDGEGDPFTSQINILNDIEEIVLGQYKYTFNTKDYSLLGNTYYFIKLSASYQSYLPSTPNAKQILVFALPASLSLHDYETHGIVNQFSEYYDELVNITVKYYSDDTDSTLYGADLVYEWNYGAGDLNPDPLNPDYYYFTIDTSDAGSVGTQIIKISAFYENYSSITNYPFALQILPRTTSLLVDGQISIFDRSYNVYVEDIKNLTLIYKDYTRNENLTGLEQTFYQPYLVKGGNYISLSENALPLVLKQDNSYILDFDTETRAVGTYLLRLTLSKTNYETQKIDITYNIILRTFESDLSAKGLDDDQITVVKGNKVTIEIELIDESKGGIPLTGAKVILEIGDDEFEFDEDEPGVYVLEFDTEDYEAFYNSQTLTGEIKITKTNYEEETIDITIVVEMEEIFPGIPVFYFIMAITAISGVVGSLVTYRLIQIARIPKFIKKAKSIKNSIKSGKEISESSLYPPKEQLFAKELEDVFSLIDISSKDIFGVKDKKIPKVSESKDINKLKRGDA